MFVGGLDYNHSIGTTYIIIGESDDSPSGGFQKKKRRGMELV